MSVGVSGQHMISPRLGHEHQFSSPHVMRQAGELRAVVLLGGALRPTQLRRSLGRFILELPVEHERTVLDCWRSQVEDLIETFELDRLPVRVMIDHATPLPRAPHWPGRAELRIERDPLEFRGTGGLLRDLANEYEDDALILVAGAAQLPLDPISAVAETLLDTDGDVRILALPDGTPTDHMLVRCGCLRGISEVGFVDLKEQALPHLACEHAVRIARRDQLPGRPIRTMAGYLEALREYHHRQQGRPAQAGAFVEDWQPTFSLVEAGAQVDPSAVLHDSVVLAGGRVEASTVLVRSIVCPGGRLFAGESAVDRLVVSSGDGEA